MVRLTGSELFRLLEDRPEIVYVEPASFPVLHNNLAARPELISVEPVWDLGYNGTEVVVSHNDTGVDLGHPDLVLVEAAGDGCPDGLGLLVHLLEHVVLIAALLGGLDVPVDVRHRSLLLATDDVGDGDGAWTDVGHVSLFEEDDVSRVGQYGRDVRGQEGLLGAQPYDERHVHLGPDHALGLAPVDDRQRVGAVGPVEGRAHGRAEVAVVGLFDEVGYGLGVGLGVEVVAAGLELGAVDYVAKPFQPAEIIARVTTHLTIQRLQRQSTGAGRRR